MAKNRINPESFRVGTFQSWPDSIKLSEYRTNARLLRILNLYYNNYWLAAQKIRDTKTGYRKFIGNKELQLFKINTQVRRRRIYYTNFLFLRKSKFPKVYRAADTFYNILPYWYRPGTHVSVNQRLFKYDNFILKSEQECLKRKNSLLFKTLQIQQFLPYDLQNVVFNVSHGLGGSTALRRYQFNLTHLQPPQWTLFIHLARHSFKKNGWLYFINARCKTL